MTVLQVMSDLKELNVSRSCALVELSESLGALSVLEKLTLDGCSKLTALPKSWGALSGLREPSLMGCSGLTVLPESLASLWIAGAQFGGLHRPDCMSEVIGDINCIAASPSGRW